MNSKISSKIAHWDQSETTLPTIALGPNCFQGPLLGAKSLHGLGLGRYLKDCHLQPEMGWALPVVVPPLQTHASSCGGLACSCSFSISYI